MADFVKIKVVRVSNFRSLENVEVQLDSLTVLVGANNSGKSSLLDAIHMAIGAGRRSHGSEDIFVKNDEPHSPKDRKAVVDILVRPVDEAGKVLKNFPGGSFWTNLWGEGIAQDEEGNDFAAFRTTLKWDVVRGEYSLARRFLKEFPPFATWLAAEEKSAQVAAAQIEPIALHYIDAKRDLDDDIKRPGSFWRRLTDDLGVPEADVLKMEAALSELNQEIVGKSGVLKHLHATLKALQTVVAAEGAGVDIAPIARRLRDLSRGVDVSFSSSGSAAFPLARHGMGTRSLASLLVFRAFVSWKAEQASAEGDQIHSVLALEEPESHLHPQAQRALFHQISKIPGQRLVSTHSAYFAGQADLANLRFFSRDQGRSRVCQLDLSKLSVTERRQLERMVIASRGDLVFSRALVLFEGETEEQALPIWAEKYFGAGLHELGFSFVSVGGRSYFPFVWLAEAIGIKWYIFSDGEADTQKVVEGQLKKAGIVDPKKCPNVFAILGGNDLEAQLIADGYESEIVDAIATLEGEKWLDKYVANMHGQKGKKNVIRDYAGAAGRMRALKDMMDENKTRTATVIAQQICDTKDPARRIPPPVRKLLAQIAAEFGIKAKA